MNFKKFAICTSIIIGIIVVTMVVLGCVHINNKLEIDTPTSYVVYLKSSAGKEYTEETHPSKYKKFNELLNNSTNLNVFDYMAKGLSLDAKASQDYSNQFVDWKEANKAENVCLEMVFDKKQTMVVNVQGNTKVVEFYSLIMQVDSSSRASRVALYFSNSTGSVKNYQEKNPICVVMKQSKLYKFLNSLSEN